MLRDAKPLSQNKGFEVAHSDKANEILASTLSYKASSSCGMGVH